MRWLTLLAVLCLASPLPAADLAPTPVATAGMTDAPPAIDGVLGDACWADSSAILRGFVETDMSAFAPVRTDARVCWDAERLYIGVRCEEPNTDALRAQMTERDDAIWRDDCIELFLDTNHDRKTYAHVIVNSLGTVYDDRIPGDASWDADVDAAAQTGDDFWAVEVAIGLDSLGGAPRPGDVWGFNLGRERYAGEGQLSIWSPTYAKFLEPDRFGELVFAERPGGFGWTLIDQPLFGLCEIGLFAHRDVQPALHLMREWPEGLERGWPTPAPEVAAGV
ncbi:MAG: sugar-binding protein, partial [Armatimonadota bacterium]